MAALSLTLMIHAAFLLTLAGVASVVAGASCWAVLRLALGRWPQLAAYRAPFIAAQAVVACAFAAALLPAAAPWRMLPAVTLAVPPQTRLAAQSALQARPTMPEAFDPLAETNVPAAPAVTAAASARPKAGLPWPTMVPLAWSMLYLAGLAWSTMRLVRTQLRWRRLRLASYMLTGDDLRAHPAFTAQQLAGIGGRLQVRQSELALSPMLLGVFRPCLLLPSHMDCFDQVQQQLIIEHELTHWRRRDPAWQALAGALQALLWFNPALRWLQRQLGWAQELGCDRAVLAGKPQKQRQLYAAALVMQLKLQAWACRQAQAVFPAGTHGQVMAFGGGSMAVRVQWMRAEQPGRLDASARLALGVAFALIAGASVVLQPALARPEPTLSMPVAAAPLSIGAPAAVAEAWRYPLAKVRVTSFFGVVSTLLPNGHRGIDFAATKGAPVMATASGSVQFVGFDERHGNYIVLEHGGGLRSLYAHLDSSTVRKGDRVSAGQRIGAVGDTGMATGPHLHLEAYRDGQLIDPQQVLSGLDGRASRRALQRRFAAFGH
jgi:murein DD-endopeptidase MepM/ murein hydrolase activator NlpD